MRCTLAAGMAGAVALLAACADNSGPDTGADFHVSPTRIWAGSDVLVQNRIFGDLEQAPVFRLADSVLAARQVNDSTWTVTLPAWAAGQVMLKLALASGDTFTLDPVSVRGFTGAHDFSTLIFETVMVWPVGGDAVVLGGDLMNLLEINATANTLVRLDSLMDWSAANFRGVGPTEQNDEFLVWPHDSTMQRWKLLPSPELVSPTTVSYARAAMQFGAGGLFVATNHEFTVTGPGPSYSEQAEEVQGAVMSPSHDRASIRVNWDQAGVPVFDVGTGTIAYRIPGVQSSEGVAFSPDGQWLAVAGGTRCVNCDSARVVLVRASDGEVMHDTTFAGTPGASSLIGRVRCSMSGSTWLGQVSWIALRGLRFTPACWCSIRAAFPISVCSPLPRMSRLAGLPGGRVAALVLCSRPAMNRPCMPSAA